MTNYNDGLWHGWNGGECPVHPMSMVEYIGARNVAEWRESFYGKVLASNISWVGDDDSFVVAFRVTKEYREPREFWVHGGMAFDSKDAAIKDTRRCWPSYVIHVREVLE
jgi:hypothetical protein